MKISAELSEVVRSIYRAMGSGDATPIIQRLSHQDGTIAIGTDPDEWWMGRERIAAALAAQEEALPGATIIGNPQAYSNGDVGWYADQANVVLAGGREIPMRITGVFEKDAGEWKVVQWHASIGIPNEDTDFGDVTI